jgi:1,2-phenylacetyl-CoA epoxidase catalytic subunit
MVSTISEETHHKMSKKIAQLTKVIFHLHSKNEENSNMHTAINNAYEKEIEMLLQQANKTITSQKDALVKANDQANLKEKISELEAEHLAERKATQKSFGEY